MESVQTGKKMARCPQQHCHILSSLVGSHYKAFLATYSLTAEELVRKALEKALMADDPALFCIWEVPSLPTGEWVDCTDLQSQSNIVCSDPADSSRALGADQCPLVLQTQWPHYNSHHFELRLKDSAHQLKVRWQLLTVLSATDDVSVYTFLTSLSAMNHIHCVDVCHEPHTLC